MKNRKDNLIASIFIAEDLKMNIDESKIIVYNRGGRKENIQLRSDDRLIKVVTNLNH